ncbi:hypothetical protein C8R44DRAFT_786259 [Mycena epipterygia]|nr:hypothetical protein C8R44DRAFT_786259 [Mycena epipterygia]
MSSAEQLAQELIDAILDFLHDDRESLLSSSLVARKWVPAPRHHIFAERIALNFTELGPPAYNRSSNTAHEFLAISRSPYCSILPAIRNVVLNVDTELDGTSGLLQEIVEVLARAPINKLMFLDHTFKSSERQPISLSWIAPHFPGLQEFSYNALYDVAGDVLALVTSFPRLQSLSVYSTSPGTSNLARGKPLPAIPHATFAHLHTLRLRLYGHQSEELLAWMNNIGGQLRLETLEINIFHCYHNGWGPVAALNSVLQINADSLRSFTLRVTYDNKEDDLDDDLRVTKPADGDVDLSVLTHLRSLHLSSHNVETICSALRSAPATLDTLEIDFPAWTYEDSFPCMCMPGLLIFEFSAVMADERFAGLTSFDIGVPHFFGDHTEFFPRWKNTEVLRVGFIDENFYQADSWETVTGLLFVEHNQPRAIERNRIQLSPRKCCDPAAHVAPRQSDQRRKIPTNSSPNQLNLRAGCRDAPHELLRGSLVTQRRRRMR